VQSSRPTATSLTRGILLPLLAGLSAAAIVVPSGGAQRGSEVGAVPRLVFPLVAKTDLWDNYGDPRPNGRHAGIDMENPWRAPVVAVEPGRVEYATSNLGGCMLYLYGKSGTMYMYIHLNNDVGPRNDNSGRCVENTAYAVRNGSSVLGGEQIAFNGDSGDADGNPHLHFEVHPSGGADVTPFLHLKRATRLLFAGREGASFSLGLRGRVLAASNGALSLSATSVRSYPGGRWLQIDARQVDLGVPPDGAVPGQLTRAIGGQRLSTLKTSARVAVFTSKAKVTKDMLLGSPGALTASRVSALSP
jgi:peptidase M23-like protein